MSNRVDFSATGPSSFGHGTVDMDWFRLSGRRERYAWHLTINVVGFNSHLTINSDNGARFTAMGESRKPPNVKDLTLKWAEQHNVLGLTFLNL